MLQATKRFWGKRPGFDSGDLLHVGVNLGFAFFVYAMVFHWELTLLAVILVIISKWRILAVQPRFWLPNTRANLVDIIVGLSTVGLLHYSDHILLAILWAALYGLWLLALKPRDHEVAVGFQAFWALLLGSSTLFMLAPFLTPFLLCIALWLVSWASARHFFSNYEEPHYRLLSLAWSFIALQIGWITLHWMQYYHVFGLRVSVSSVVICILGFSLGSMYHMFKGDSLTKAAIIENVAFGGVLLTVILLSMQWSAGM